MRRRLFVFVMALTAILFLLDAVKIPLRVNHLRYFEDSDSTITGRVIAIEEKSDYIRLKVRPMVIDGVKVRGRECILVNYYGDTGIETESYFREIISIRGMLKLPDARRNPKCFDYGKYLLSIGIRYIVNIESIELIKEKAGLMNRIEKFLFLERKLFKEALPADDRGIIMGILFADTSYLDEEIYENFRMNGTAHILAVSGLHIGILYDIYKKISKRRKRKVYLYLFFFLLFCYGTLSMWSVSTIRAVFMIVTLVIAEKFALRYDSLSSLSAAAFLLIIFNPYVIFSAGFQMSFLAVMSINFFKELFPQKIPDFLKNSLAVTVGLSFYQMYVFNFFAPLSFIVNVPIILLAGYLVPCALTAFVLFLLSGTFFLLEPVFIGLSRMIVFINDFSTLNGHASFQVMSSSAFIASFITIITFFLSSETFAILLKKYRKNKDKTKIIYNIYVIVIISIMFGLFSYSPLTHDDIIFIDVGQGDATHINCGNVDVLIDGGGQRNYNIGKNTLKSYFLKNGNSDVDLAVSTHKHMDHFKGLTELTDCFKVKSLKTGLTAGNNFIISDKKRKKAEIRTLWPLETGKNEQDENKNCSVFLVTYNGYKIMITGDLDSVGEREMISYYENSGEGLDVLDCDILKIGHHGSETATSDEFLKVTSPRYAVIQVGKNMYGHPSPETVEKLEKNDIIILRNDKNGAVGFSLGYKGIKCHTMIE